MAVILGTSGADSWDHPLVTTNEDDIVSALAGNDVIIGSAGGNDTLDGGEGSADSITFLNSPLLGITINNTDSIQGEQAAYSINKGNGFQDQLIDIEYFEATDGDDIIYQGAGTWVAGRAGNDLIYAMGAVGSYVSVAPGIGNDTIVGNGLCDTLINYDSEFEWRPGGNKTYPTKGISVVYLDGLDGIVIDDGYGFTDRFYGVNQVDGSWLGDYMVGGLVSVRFYGSLGDDTFVGNSTADVLNGGQGDDTYYIHASSETLQEAADEGTDSVYSSASYGLSINIERLTLTGATAINGYGNSAANVITGNSVANTLSGYDGNDTLMGGGGNDTLEGGNGADSLSGGNGNDTYIYLGADTITEAANAGIDLVQTSGTYTLGSNIENLTLTGSGAVNATGNSLNNLLTGNSAANILSGGNGKDTLVGGGGTDRLYGGADSAQDMFVFNAITDSVKGASKDGIFNFVSGTDKIDLHLIDANTSLFGDQTFRFNGSTSAANAVWCTTSGTTLVVNGDVTGDKIADFQIAVDHVSSLLAGDFLL